MKIKRILVPALILLASALVATALVKTRPQVETQEVVTLAPLVRVLTVHPEDRTLSVETQGTVLPRTETTLIAQVGGEVQRVSPNFEVGDFFGRGEVLVELDPRNYEVAVQRARAQVAQAELQVELQEAEARVAAEEWRELGDGEPNPLVLREPQRAQARAALEAARAELAKAELDLERTRLRGPFAGRVRAKLAALGQFLAPGAPLATIHPIDYAEVRLPVPDDQLAFLDLPFLYRDAGSGADGPEVVLRARFGGSEHSWSGRIVRTAGELDPRSRMLHLVARVENPYLRSEENAGRPPLAIGLFVDAEIRGERVEDVFVLPRVALRPAGRRSGDQVLVVDDDSRLRFRDVEVLRRVGDEVIVSGGLAAGERVCISPLDAVVDGMRVRTVAEREDRPSPEEASS